MENLKMNMPSTGNLSRETMSKALGKASIDTLAKSLRLTQEQQISARSYALQLSSDDKLKNVDPHSIIKFVFETIGYGFARKDAIYPVPYKGKLQALVSYKGFRELALRTGKYSKISAVEVRACDKVIRDSATGEIKVIFNENYDESLNSEVIGYFAFALSSEKERYLVNFTYMNLDEIKRHAERFSQSYNKSTSRTFWNDTEFGFSDMAKKTVIKRLTAELEQTPALTKLQEIDQLVFGKENESNTYVDNKIHDFTDNENKTADENGEIKLVADEINNDAQF